MQLEQHKIQLQYEIDRNKNEIERKYRNDWYEVENEKLRLKKTRCMMEILITIKWTLVKIARLFLLSL